VTEQTLLLIKPDAFQRNLSGKIIERVEAAGFRIAGLKMVQLQAREAREFYAVHEGKPFLDELVEFMSSGPIIAMKLTKNNAITDLRDLIGATDPSKAACGTVRQCFAESITRNSVHASDSPESAGAELRFFFREEDG
jgi:nucleoside-diphosphate kinase